MCLYCKTQTFDFTHMKITPINIGFVWIINAMEHNNIVFKWINYNIFLHCPLDDPFIKFKLILFCR